MVLPPDALDVVADNHRLLAVAVGRLVDEFLALVVLAEHILLYLSLVVTNQTVGGLHDALGGTVVLFQFEEFRIIELLLEVQDVVDIGSTKRIDALCIIAHHTDMLVLLDQLQHDGLLRVVRVLILIDEHIVEALRIFLADVLVFMEKDKGV